MTKHQKEKTKKCLLTLPTKVSNKRHPNNLNVPDSFHLTQNNYATFCSNADRDKIRGIYSC